MSKRNLHPLANYALVDNLIFTLQERLGKRWKGIFPNGKLPDEIGFLLSEVRRIWYQKISQLTRGGG